MSFYRVATAKDFEIYKNRFEFMPDSIKDIIESDKIATSKTVLNYRELTYKGIDEALWDCKKYVAYVLAYDDFRNGIDVYTEY